MDIKELREKNETELNKLLAEFREKLRDMNFNVNLKQVKNTAGRLVLKRDIARILTVLSERTQENE